MTKATLFHAGGPACVAAEKGLAQAIDDRRYRVEVVHLGLQPQRLAEAMVAGVKSVPALVVGKDVFHINFGAWLEDLAEDHQEGDAGG